MINTFIGDLGHFLVITGFVTAAMLIYAYFSRLKDESWNKLAVFSVIGHFIAITGVVVVLYTILGGSYYEYHYAYNHTSNTLPWYYVISSFWEGQEGSFLLWMWWNAVIGLFLLRVKLPWRVPVLVVFGFIQLFLTSMILGVVIPGIELKVGSSPFILLRDAMEAPIFTMNPNFIPGDGSGLNPLLQNYWMVIHPPVLFLGFALTMVPFAFVVAALWLKKYTEWIQLVKPWAVLTAAVLGLGILMGGYWAYETLNFGGYWNWDPVENAVYVPWLILIAAIHTIILAKNNTSLLKLSLVLFGSVFLLILYSTFLTRSGVLGDTSVHSFTDLGLSGQLLLYLLSFITFFIIILIFRWKDLPKSKEEDLPTSQPAFWLFLGSLVLCLMGFQVLIPTSIPVYNTLMNWLGITSQAAPPADQVAYYSKFQLWFAVGIAILSGIAVLIYYRKDKNESLLNKLAIPLIITLILSLILIEGADITKFSFIVLLVSAVFTLVVNASLVITLARNRVSTTGGTVAHIGMALMLIGILFSAGFDRVVSLNTTGLLIAADQSTEFNNENLLLFVNEPKKMGPYTLTYLGERWETKDGEMIDKYKTTRSDLPEIILATEVIKEDDKVLYQAGDSIEIKPENTYYEVAYDDEDANRFVLYPRAQINEDMGGLLASPDIRKNVMKDLYTHVSSVRNPKEPVNWSEVKEDTVELKSTLFINDYVAEVQHLRRLEVVPGMELKVDDIAVEANLMVRGEKGEYPANPLFLIRDNRIAKIPAEIPELGLRVFINNIIPESNSVALSYQTRQKDWIVLKAVEKPWINILWLGTGVLMVGFAMSTYKRFKRP